METIETIRRQFRFTDNDQTNLATLGGILLPHSDQMAEDFYTFLAQEPETARYFQTEKAITRRKETFKTWFHELLTAKFDHRYLLTLRRIGKVHVDIRLKSYHVNAAMNYIRELCTPHVVASVEDGAAQEDLLNSLHKALDINLSVMTSSFHEEKLNKVFLSYKLESNLIRWAERLLHGLNLLLVIGLLVMAGGVVSLLVVDITHAFTTNLEQGVIKALGSLLILWMMIELLHTEISTLRGGNFHVRIFVELAMVAFIRKLFVASFEHREPVDFMLLLAALLVLGLIYFFVAKKESSRK